MKKPATSPATMPANPACTRNFVRYDGVMEGNLMARIEEEASNYHVCPNSMIAMLCTRALLRGAAAERAEDLRRLGSLTVGALMVGDGDVGGVGNVRGPSPAAE